MGEFQRCDENYKRELSGNPKIEKYVSYFHWMN
jgi:hypothetical protein